MKALRDDATQTRLNVHTVSYHPLHARLPMADVDGLAAVIRTNRLEADRA